MNKKYKTISEEVETISPYDFEGSLGNLYAQIGQWVQEYGHDATIAWDPHFHYSFEESPSPRFKIKINRPETDAEIEARIAQEKDHRDAQKARDLAELDRLQKLYGKGN
jgi:hypothetical protein